MSKNEFKTYQALYESIQEVIKPPDIMIYLDCPPRILKKRISKRNRSIEAKIPESYIKSLSTLYKRWLGKYDKSPLIKFPTGQADYLSDFIHRQDLLGEIERYL
jgi:deoxyadenosine/deoxycytidine kinase